MRKILFLVILSCFGVSVSEGMPQAAAHDTSRVNALVDLARACLPSDIRQSTEYGHQALDLSTRIKWKEGLMKSYMALATCCDYTSDLYHALSYQLKALQTIGYVKTTRERAILLRRIALAYAHLGDDVNAEAAIHRAMQLSTTLGDSSLLGNDYLALGLICFFRSDWPRERENLLKAESLHSSVHDTRGLASDYYEFGRMALWSATDTAAAAYFRKALGLFILTKDTALTKVSEALLFPFTNARLETAIPAGMEDPAVSSLRRILKPHDYGIYLADLGRCWRNLHRFDKAMRYYDQANELGYKIGGVHIQRLACQELSGAYAELGNYHDAVDWYAGQSDMESRIAGRNSTAELNRKEIQLDFTRKQLSDSLHYEEERRAEQVRIHRQKSFIFSTSGAAVLVTLFLALVFSQRNKIRSEKKRSEELLLNILPSETAEELRSSGAARVRTYDLVTIMFTDFKDFTQTSALLTPEELVAEINYCYSEYDRIITRYGIEKIKTIGDSYMCAGGLPVPNKTHAEDVVGAALDILKFMDHHVRERLSQGKPYFDLRIGIHTGPVVAGIVGIKKYAYDIWGNSVNTASRMESSGEPGKINISSFTYEMIKDKFSCEYRGQVVARHLGEIDMYFVTGRLNGPQ